jgi:hypothetical protein
MRVKQRVYENQTDFLKTDLTTVFTNELIKGQSNEQAIEDVAITIANLSELLVKKGIITLDEIGKDILALENYSDDPVLILDKS